MPSEVNKVSLKRSRPLMTPIFISSRNYEKKGVKDQVGGGDGHYYNDKGY